MPILTEMLHSLLTAVWATYLSTEHSVISEKHNESFPITHLHGKCVRAVQVVAANLDNAGPSMMKGPDIKPIGGNIMAHAATTRLCKHLICVLLVTCSSWCQHDDAFMGTIGLKGGSGHVDLN